MKKVTIIDRKLQEYIVNEKKILLQINSAFIVKLIKTFKDRKYVYYLQEACIGGSLKILLDQNQNFNEDVTRFCVACVILGLKYLHEHSIVYRDLQPSNILIDDRGYCKLTNLFYAKKLSPGQKTCSFCAAPERAAPEVILNKGYDFSVDYWGLGILIFELLSGISPFDGRVPLKCYSLIRKGFEQYVFPSSISKNSQIFIKKLCRIVPGERMAYFKRSLNEVTKQRWFENFDWLSLQQEVLEAPIMTQRTKSSEAYDDDEDFPRDDEIPPDELSGWDKDF